MKSHESASATDQPQPPTGTGETRRWLSERTNTLLLAVLLVLATVFAYQRAWNAGFIWDDDDYVIHNELLTAPDGLKRIWFSLDSPSQYFPLTYTTFRIERQFWGLNASGYHWVNIFLHAINALLVWRLLHRLKIPGAWLAAAIFALHPVHVESVAWITERKNVLSLFFFMLSLLAWVEFVMESSPRWRFYLWSLVFCALALFSKTTACTLPAALVLVLWLKHIPITKRRVLQIIPYVLMGLAMGLLAIWWERHRQGTQGEAFAIGFLERVLIASRAIWFYLGKLLWPAELIFSYPRWTINPANPAAYLWLAACGGLAALIFYLRRFFGRGPEVAAVFYVATLSPMLGFIMLYTFIWSFVADHYQYVASIGPISLFAASLTVGFKRIKRVNRLLPAVVCAGLLIVLGILTWRQCAIYANVETLWRATIARNSNSWLATYNLGTILGQRGEVEEAIAHLEKTVEIRPQFAGGHYNLGSLYLHKGETDRAMFHLQKAIDFEPRHALAYYKLGNALLAKNRIAEAIFNYRKAVEIYPAGVDAHRSLAKVLFQIGQFPPAIHHFERTVELQPGNPADYIFLGNAHLQLQQFDAAVFRFQQALTLQPDYLAYNNLGNALLQKGYVTEAITHFEKSLELQPNLLAQNNLAWLMATCPDPAVRNGNKAVALAEQAANLANGQNAIVFATLGAAYAETGRFTDAVEAAQRGHALALAENNSGLATALQSQIELYRAGLPFRLSPPTNSPPTH